MPPEVQNRSLDLDTVGRAVIAYNTQTDGPRFKIITSRWGWHIVPDRVRNVDGQFEPTKSLLDTAISIPAAKRTPLKHMETICEAVTAATETGFVLKPNIPWLDQYFAPENTIPRWANDEELEKISFEWGCDQTNARNAVIDLLEYSSSTLSWRVLCEPGEQYCVFNIMPVMVPFIGPDGKMHKTSLVHDRDSIRRH